MDPFVSQLARLCRDQVTRCKWVPVPSHTVGRTIGERIALCGTNWLNLRFVTPLDIARAWACRFSSSAALIPRKKGSAPR
jgi:hypothetical protein